MPCYTIDGDEVACTIDGKPNPDVAFGFGLDYEQAKKAASATEKAPARTTQIGGASPTPIFGVQFIDDGKGGGYYADANGRRLNPAELSDLYSTQKPAARSVEDEIRIRSTPSVSTSTSYHQPNELEIRKYQEEAAREDVKIRILQEQNRIANDRNNRLDAREIARDIEAAQYRRDQAYARVEELNTAAMNRAAEFNASASETAAQRQESARQTNIAGQRQNAVDIANYQQMPGDVGMLGAYLAARQGDGGSPISTAIGQGENFITDRSLAPLGTLLDTREQLSRPTIFNAARYDPALIQPQAQAPLIQRQAPPAPAPNGLPTQEQYGAAGGANPGGLAGLSPEQFAAVPDFVKTTGPSGEPLAGGQAIRNVVGSEENPINPAAALAQFFAQNPGITPPAPAPVQQQTQPLIQRESSYQPMTVTYGEPTQRNPGARIFQRQAATEARDRSGLRGDLTPIAFSDPGTDQYLAELAGSVTAAERGVDRRLFERERTRLAPRRMPVFGRSR